MVCVSMGLIVWVCYKVPVMNTMNTYTDMLNITYKIGQDFGTRDSTKIKVIRLFSKYSSPL